GETSFGSFVKKRYRFIGKERGEESGLNYHAARYYAPWVGRWVSCDPAGLVDGSNLYQYVKGNPLRLIDYTGTQSKNWHRTKDGVYVIDVPLKVTADPSGSRKASKSSEEQDEHEHGSAEEVIEISQNFAALATEGSKKSIELAYEKASEEALKAL